MKLTKDQWQCIFARLGKPFNKEEMAIAYKQCERLKDTVRDPVAYIIAVASKFASDRKRVRKAARVGSPPPRLADIKLNIDDGITLEDILSEWKD